MARSLLLWKASSRHYRFVREGFAVGIGGITSAMTDGSLIPDLSAIIRKYKPTTIYFLGDSDTLSSLTFQTKPSS